MNDLNVCVNEPFVAVRSELLGFFRSFVMKQTSCAILCWSAHASVVRVLRVTDLFSVLSCAQVILTECHKGANAGGLLC